MKGFNFKEQSFVMSHLGKGQVTIERNSLFTAKQIHGVLTSWKIEDHEVAEKLFLFCSGNDDSACELTIFTNASETIVGMAYIGLFELAPKSAMITNFVIAPDRRNKRNGRLFVETLCFMYGNRGINVIQVVPTAQSAGFWNKCKFDKPEKYDAETLFPGATSEQSALFNAAVKSIGAKILIRSQGKTRENK